MQRRQLLIAMTFAIFTGPILCSSDAGDWAGFRGPNGTGIAAENNLPTEWSAEKNVKWRTPLPGPGNSSPIVSNGRVFITCAEDKGTKRNLYCLDRKTGKQLWM